MNTIKLLAVLFVVFLSVFTAALATVYLKTEAYNWSIGLLTYPVLRWIVFFKSKGGE
jgi:hypothetical protein